jgi:hypothetical protein
MQRAGGGRQQSLTRANLQTSTCRPLQGCQPSWMWTQASAGPSTWMSHIYSSMIVHLYGCQSIPRHQYQTDRVSVLTSARMSTKKLHGRQLAGCSTPARPSTRTPTLISEFGVDLTWAFTSTYLPVSTHWHLHCANLDLHNHGCQEDISLHGANLDVITDRWHPSAWASN